MERLYSYTKRGLIILFVPMLFASFFFLGQTPVVFNVLKYKHTLRVGEFVIENITRDVVGGTSSGGGTSSYTDYNGKINGREVAVWRGNVRSFTRQQNPKIGDTIYVWYSTESKFIRPRNKEEIVFRPTHYMYEGYRLFMFITIPTYILLIILYKRLKKKIRANETKQCLANFRSNHF